MVRLAMAAAAALALAALGAGPAGAQALPSNSDLQVVRIDPDAVAPGGQTVVHAFVANDGPATTASPFTLEVEVPAGFTLLPPTFPAGCTTTPLLVSCTFGPGLAQGRTATALVPVEAGASVPPGTVTQGHVRVISADDRHPGNNTTPFTLRVS
ncbi:hypothetical protein CFP65_6297 [Kitasatospora sp. MMS16-BH015]|uniref:hypothetical protein n=1 Tax=Kitasatospora sp. MMS16-BH015 TaxID=2018025 RepID=UPI000CA379DB|nr:hypothetical protein [Kitasatospora sp. MMS16-BH015]AUG80959.1 hypothetical protein CFP65_6297 [Kitasatospora sp. MMS16-BH015]